MNANVHVRHSPPQAVTKVAMAACWNSCWAVSPKSLTCFGLYSDPKAQGSQTNEWEEKGR